MATRSSKKASPSTTRGSKGKSGTGPRAEDVAIVAPAPDARLERLKALVSILESSSLAALQYEDEDIAVNLSRHATGVGVQHVMTSAPMPYPASGGPAATLPAKSESAPAKAAPAEDHNVHVVRSPFVGTFYSAPSPEAEAYCEVGKRVRRGQTLCIIEAMKLMNEIESEVDGVVQEIVAENGKPVQYGDALFKIQKQS